MYGLIVVSKEAKGEGGSVFTRRNTKFWVCKESEGWVLATSTQVDSSGYIPSDLKTFETEKEAISFVKDWKGHPWWCRPYKHKYEVVKLKIKTKEVFDRYEIVDDEPINPGADRGKSN